MKITARELNRATLDRQLLLRREPLGVEEGVRRVLALQAQQPASPYVALWNRLTEFDPAELDAAFTDGSVVKATLMRITLHAVHTEDYRVLREAMQQTLYASRLGFRFAAAGLTPKDAGRLVPGLLKFAEQGRTKAELESWLEERVGAEKKDGALWGLRAYAPLLHVPAGGAWSFGTRASYAAAPSRPAVAGPEHVPDAMRHLVLRYLKAFGPGSVADVAQFAMVRRGPVREALGALDGVVERFEGPDGTAVFDVVDAGRPAAEVPAPPRLMAMWDSVLLAFAERSRVIPEEYRRQVIRINGDVLPTILVDGYVAGVWRPADGGIEVTAFHDLAPAVWEGLAEEARSLGALLADRDPLVYSRYRHWWSKISGSQVRVLALR
ncbi:winged helix DNA-binding domain-containing protein [Streptomyces sp. NBC_00102]|uniref:winged helix DNA-binding domain-containing protein n=1 Tax=Streptomyces sp. NBC_00102 TaxID=2975652 RepID=UPI002256029C|nr:winged helix DNA-binding domain-containing protein [Streptomyces sp. NBC_00102]MCX5401799.1 winged helix DNA-binding domain-containing protein [Streptomyces sp. NBC_00102]